MMKRVLHARERSDRSAAAPALGMNYFDRGVPEPQTRWSSRRSLDRCRAFSFVEIMMVVFVLCICILPMIGHMTGRTRETGHTMYRSLGMTLCGQTMERFRNLSFDDLLAKCATPISEDGLTSDPMLKLDTYPPDLRRLLATCSYKRTVKFEEKTDPRLSGPAATTAKIGLLTVEVSWKPPNLPDAKLTLSKIIVGHQW